MALNHSHLTPLDFTLVPCQPPRRLWPVLVMRTLICVLPFASDTVGLFPPPENFTPARQASWGLFMLVRPVQGAAAAAAVSMYGAFA